MTTKPTSIILTLLFLTFVLFACRQNKKSENNSVEAESYFSLSISTYNHAEYLFTGALTYNLTNNILSISRQPSLSDTSIVLLTKTIDRNSIGKIKNMRIDSLDDFYFNKCVMATSGNEYSISIVNDTIKKTIRLHAYFEEHIEMLINELNKHIPDSLQISYYTIERKKEQDCE